MITEPTVLILGAGASEAYGFPLGQGLVRKVCEIMEDQSKKEAIESAGYAPEELSNFIETLSSYGAPSVDSFLERCPKFIPIGKAAIATALIPLEDPIRLLAHNIPNPNWYQLLINALDEPIGSFLENKVSIITFNYDRSLDYYLFKALSKRYDSEEHAMGLFKQFNLVHVHGELGSLVPIHKEGRPYDGNLDVENIRIASEKIIIDEASEGTEEFKKAKLFLSEAKRIIFLGFGYHAESIRRLGIFDEWDDDKKKLVRVVGTTVGITPKDLENIQERVLNRSFSLPRSGHGVYDYLREVEPL